MTTPIRVVYDISLLGESHFFPDRRTGIHRAVESLALELARRTDIDLSFAASRSLLSLSDSQAYLISTQPLRDVPLIGSAPARGLAGDIARGATRIKDQAGGGDGRRIVDKLSRTVFQALAEALPSIQPTDLRGHGVFHMPAHPLPPASQRSRDYRYVVTIYDIIADVRPDLAPIAHRRHVGRLRATLRPEDVVVSDSEWTKRDLVEHWGIDPQRIFVAPLAADRAIFHPVKDLDSIAGVRRRLGIPNGDYVLTVNASDPRKNIGQAIRSFVDVIRQQRIVDLYFVLVGAGGIDVGTLFESSGDIAFARKHVCCTGYVRDEDLAALYSGARFFVFPSHYEGFGLPPLEAMQCGTPVITSNTSSLPEVVGDAGVVIDPTDATALSAAMLDLHRDDAKRAMLAALAIARSAHFTWKRTADHVVDAYRAALE